MTRHLSLIGVGSGDPGQVTHEAARAIRAADVVFIVDKPGERADLVHARERILAEHAGPAAPRVVAVTEPQRDRSTLDADAYVAAVDDWRAARANVWAEALARELADDGRGAFLVWGDPALYDSSIAIVDQIAERLDITYDVIPGLSAVATLTARHRVSLNRVGQPVLITTGRRLEKGWPADVDDVVVMLDASCTFLTLGEPDAHIYWGAYLGTADELLIAGRIADVGEQIAAARSDARERKGWIMDTYLLRRA